MTRSAPTGWFWPKLVFTAALLPGKLANVGHDGTIHVDRCTCRSARTCRCVQVYWTSHMYYKSCSLHTYMYVHIIYMYIHTKLYFKNPHVWGICSLRPGSALWSLEALLAVCLNLPPHTMSHCITNSVSVLHVFQRFCQWGPPTAENKFILARIERTERMSVATSVLFLFFACVCFLSICIDSHVSSLYSLPVHL